MQPDPLFVDFARRDVCAMWYMGFLCPLNFVAKYIISLIVLVIELLCMHTQMLIYLILILTMITNRNNYKIKSLGRDSRHSKIDFCCFFLFSHANKLSVALDHAWNTLSLVVAVLCNSVVLMFYYGWVCQYKVYENSGSVSKGVGAVSHQCSKFLFYGGCCFLCLYTLVVSSHSWLKRTLLCFLTANYCVLCLYNAGVNVNKLV